MFGAFLVNLMLTWFVLLVGAWIAPAVMVFGFWSAIALGLVVAGLFALVSGQAGSAFLVALLVIYGSSLLFATVSVTLPGALLMALLMALVIALIALGIPTRREIR